MLRCSQKAWFKIDGRAGAESIHAHIINFKRQHERILDGLDNLKCIMKEHILESDPSLTCLRPSPEPRKTEGIECTSSGIDNDCSF